MASMRQQPVPTDCNTDAEMARLAHGCGVPARQKAEPQQAVENRSILARIIERQVVPGLHERHRPGLAAAQGEAVPAVAIGPSHVVALADLALAADDAGPLAFVLALHGDGASPESLYLDLIGPAAMRLGVMWEQDLCDFTQVTIGVWRLQAAMRELSPAFVGTVETGLAAPSIMLLPMPGAQHTFALTMVRDFFHRAGWNAWFEAVASDDELVARAGGQWADVIGLSIACDDQLEAAAAAIAAVRRASCNPAVKVMIGGPAVIAQPEIAVLAGADAVALDGRQATAEAQKLLRPGATGVRSP